MVVVSAVAFAVALLCFYFGARTLRTRRALAQLGRREGDERADTFAWPGSAEDPERPPRAAAAERTAEDVSVERGFVLLALGLVCGLLGVIAL